MGWDLGEGRGGGGWCCCGGRTTYDVRGLAPMSIARA